MELLFKSSWIGVSGISLLTFLLGILLGHKLNIHRDKRSRLFELCKEIKPYFIEQTKNPSSRIDNKVINNLDGYVHYMAGISFTYKKKAENLERLVEDFFSYLKQESSSKDFNTCNYYNDIIYFDIFSIENPDEVCKKAKEILKYLND